MTRTKMDQKQLFIFTTSKIKDLLTLILWTRHLASNGENVKVTLRGGSIHLGSGNESSHNQGYIVCQIFILWRTI